MSAFHIAAKEDNVLVMKELITACPDIYELLDTTGVGMLLMLQQKVENLGMQWGGAGPMDGIFAPAPHGFFLPHPYPLRPHEDPRSPALPRKTLFLINFPYNYYHFFK